MLKQLIFIGILSMLSVATFGQDKITIKAEKLSDLVPQSFYKTKYQVGYLFKVGDGEYQPVGYKAEKLEAILKTDEAAYQEFKRFKRKNAIGKISYWAGIGGMLALTLSVDNNDSFRQAENKRIGALATLLGGTITYLLLNKNSTKHLVNAVEIYNQNLK